MHQPFRLYSGTHLERKKTLYSSSIKSADFTDFSSRLSYALVFICFHSVELSSTKSFFVANRCGMVRNARKMHFARKPETRKLKPRFLAKWPFSGKMPENQKPENRNPNFWQNTRFSGKMPVFLAKCPFFLAKC